MARYEEAGRGRKQCPGCDMYVGAKSHKCECGHEFHKDAPTPEGDESEPKHVRGVRAIETPAGKCPVKLTSTEREDVAKWREKVLADGDAKGILYLPKALRYYARYSFEIGSADVDIVLQHLAEITEDEQEEAYT